MCACVRARPRVGEGMRVRESVCVDVKCTGASECPSAWNESAPTRQILMKLGISTFFEHLSRKFKFH